MLPEQPSEQQAQGEGIAQASQGGSAVVNIYHPLPTSRDSHRERLLTKVRTFWVTGVLEQSLHGMATLALGLEEQFDAAFNPWRLVIQECDHMSHQLPPGKSLLQVYDEVGGELLILGEPGSGKTTLLLQLTRSLLERAQQEDSHPIPVVFNLSSWAAKGLPLKDWLVEELSSKYQVSSNLGREWLAKDQILPLLDGLDEVKIEQRTKCIEAINTYKQEHGLVPLVICCRSTDYQAVAPLGRLAVLCAVTILPLTPQQIDDYLASAGEQLVAVRKALQADPDLQEMATTPLMLNVLKVAYAGRSVDKLVKESSWQYRRQEVFTAYIERMLHRRGATSLYTSEQTVHWLAWLAGQLKEKNQTIFHIERMQLSWLAKRSERVLYNILVRGSIGVLIGLIGCLSFLLYILAYTFLTDIFSFGFFVALSNASSDISGENLHEALLFGGCAGMIYVSLIQMEPTIRPAEIITWSWKNIWQNLSGSQAWRIGLAFGLVGVFLGASLNVLFGALAIRIALGGLLFGFFGGLLFETLRNLISTLPEEMHKELAIAPSDPEHRGIGHNQVAVGIIAGLVMGVFFGIVAGLLAWLVAGLNALSNGRLYWTGDVLLVGLQVGLISAILIGGSGGLLIGRMCHVETRLRPVKTICWFWKNTLHRLKKNKTMEKTLAVGLIFGLLSWFSIHDVRAQFEAIWLGVRDGLLGGLMFGILNVLVSGLSSKMVEEQTLVRPNQGIVRSRRNSIRIGLIFGLLGWLFFGLTQALAYAPDYGWSVGVSLLLSYGLSMGILSAFFIGLLNGGLAWIQHTMLRLLLWHAGSISWRYACFLDYAAERVLLHKVGGGYIFIHRLLLDHFASLTLTEPYSSASTQAMIDEKQTFVEGIRTLPAKKRPSIRAFHLSFFDLISLGLIMGVLIITWHVWDNTRHFYPAASWHTVLNDPLANNQLLWDVKKGQDGECLFKNGAYYISALKQKDNYCLEKKRSFRDFAFEVQMVTIKGGDCWTIGVPNSCGGLVFRFDARSQSFYELWIEGHKNNSSLPYWGIDLYQQGRKSAQVAAAPNKAISQDPRYPNTVAIVVQGNTFDIYIQKKYIATVNSSDESLHQGQIGLIGNNQGGPVEIKYRNLRVWTLSP